MSVQSAHEPRTSKPAAITARGLTKQYGRTVAVRDLSFTVRPGVVTGFLGANGAGKSTTMRMLIGLDRPNTGQALVNGRPYRELRRPLREVGVMLEAKSFHPGRSAQAHLQALAVSNDIPDRRVEEVLGIVGLESPGRRRAGKFSLTVIRFLPQVIAESSLTAVKPVTDSLPAGLGLGMLCLYAAVALAVGGWSLARRDA